MLLMSISFDYYMLLKDNGEYELYELAKYAEKLYSLKFFQSVPNAVRFFFESIIYNACRELGIDDVSMIDTDRGNHFSIDKSVSALLDIKEFKNDIETRKALRQCQKQSNEGSHRGSEELDEYTLKENANLTLQSMARVYKWYCGYFLKSNIPFEYSLPKFSQNEDYEDKYKSLAEQYDKLEKENIKLTNELKELKNDLKNKGASSKTEIQAQVKQLSDEKDAIVLEYKNRINNIKNDYQGEISDLKNKNSELEDSLSEKESSIIDLKKTLKEKDKKISQLYDDLKLANTTTENLKIQKEYLSKLQRTYYTNNVTDKKADKKSSESVNSKYKLIEQKARQEAQKDSSVDIKLYDVIFEAIKTMYNTNHSIYITRNTIKYFIQGSDALIISTYKLHEQPGFGCWCKKPLDIQQIEDVLYYLEDGHVITSNSGYYTPLTVESN